MKYLPLLFTGLLIAAPACFAQANGDAATSPSASELDLTLPKASTYQYHNDPPGTWYGDTRRMPAMEADDTPIAAREDYCDGKPHGTVAAGVGHSSRGGNSNWQGFNLNGCKTRYNDEGEPRQMGFSISVDRYDGPGYGGYRAQPMHGPRR